MDEERSGFWDQLSPHDQDRLTAAGRIGKYQPGVAICRQGEPATHLFVLVDGMDKVVTVSRDGEEAVLALRGDGDVVGEFAGELTGYRTATMYALEDVLAVLVPHRRFSAYLNICPRPTWPWPRGLRPRARWPTGASATWSRPATGGSRSSTRPRCDAWAGSTPSWPR